MLLSATVAGDMDQVAATEWALSPFALVDAAGRNCARVFAEAFPLVFDTQCLCTGVRRIVALVGSGNNGADALLMLRALILMGRVDVDECGVLISRVPASDDASPLALAFRALQALGVYTNTYTEKVWDAGIIIDGITGTGLRGPLREDAAKLVSSLNTRTARTLRNADIGLPFVVSVDVPSGCFDEWQAGMPLLRADVTLAIEPLKAALYKPLVRAAAGTILPVREVFAPKQMAAFFRHTEQCIELLDWEEAWQRISVIKPDAYKYERGVAEIHAGSAGSAGAARIAAQGALAAGAGITRLIVDDALYPIVAVNAGGAMVVPTSVAVSEAVAPRFESDAMLLGPGWGRGAERVTALEAALAREAVGIPLILDADAIALAKGRVFHGNVILTPHAGELAAYTGLPKEAALANPYPILTALAREKQATILFKSHVLIIAAPDGRVGVVDGMTPVLSAGGSGDLLAGICVALAARMKRVNAFDSYICATCAAALLIEAARGVNAFVDPLDLAVHVGKLAGTAWLDK
jgi:NAD(P)H-hydrate epimerase